MRRSFERRGVLPPGDPRVAQIGFPKTDRLIDGTLDRAAVLREIGFAGDRPVVMFAPTGAHGNAMELYGENLIKTFAASGDYDLLVKPHDHAKAQINWFDHLAHLEDEHTRLLRTFDSIPALFAADVLISDASSIANEYLLLNRPLIFLDVPVLLASAAGEDDRLDLETWGRKGGTVVGDVADAERAVEAGLEHPQAPSEIRTAMTKELFFHPGTTTDAAISWFQREALQTA
jgi:CDP-glycerol glycerophosphotransferase (TagB/SpsB family)